MKTILGFLYAIALIAGFGLVFFTNLDWFFAVFLMFILALLVVEAT